MEFVLDLLKHVLITAVSYIIYLRMINTRFNLFRNVLFGVGYVILMASMFLAFNYSMAEPYRGAIVVIISSVLLTIVSKEKFDVIIVFCLASYTVSYVLVYLSTIISGIPFIVVSIYTINIMGFIALYVLSITFLYLLSKLKINTDFLRRKGFKGTILSLCVVIFILNSLFREPFEYRVYWLLLACVTLIAYGMYSESKRINTAERNEKNHKILHKQHEKQISEQEKELASLTVAHNDMASKIHSNGETLTACERVTNALLRDANRPDIIARAQQSLAEISAYKEEFSKELAPESSYKGKTIPLTGWQFVDAGLGALLEKATKKNIDFDVKIIGEIGKIDQNPSQLDLVNLIGNLAKNAFIAIKHTGGCTHSSRCVLIHLSLADNAYEISIEDSGIPFGIDTLINLGKTRITTHANEGGNGYGYKTIFEMMRRYNASLIITEYRPESHTYTKRVTFRFDGKTSYTVKSYRAKLLAENNTNDGLSIVELS
jgi:anti-sigma regulatory factor (Ser/Thr protein kinase)